MKMLAEEVLRLSRQRILVNMRFLEPAMTALPEKCYEELKKCMGTDGRYIYYDPEYVLRTYQKEKGAVIREYLHLIVHGIFRHFFVGPSVEREKWNLACDMATEYVIESWKLDFAQTGISQDERREFDRIKKETGLMNAEKIYSYLKVQEEAELLRLENIFRRDDHSIWYPVECNQKEWVQRKWNQAESDSEERSLTETDLEDQWKQISQKIQVDLETFMRGRSSEAGEFLMNLKLANRKKQDYSMFLKKFSRLDERMKINDEEFDYNFYTYGMQLYGNMPLIEPLEYKDIRLVKAFAIVIDTSGSVEEEKLRKFLEKTYQILSDCQQKMDSVNIHLIQCDAEVQTDVRITSGKQLEYSMDQLVVRGRGGTDFRPAFEYVDTLRRNGSLSNLNGLLYFTDGEGIYPGKKPDYPVAFVFDSDTLACIPKVPAWGMRYLLDDISDVR